ncbi:hypothetical protein [Allobranchiibius sp. GilTou38]|uniref:hypothetical protein n=1 Tax=Allobranchiibius sp. GilTou38 TaxID=2815210 RepID=UPI001AA193CB|nr:hypothetical protein [Allobranchiibius sp. GilTou38]MBO1767921.1 hypothetical protein [Allobranchiibius sp. GilTou38]
MIRRLAALGALPAIAALGVAVTAPAGAATTTRTVHHVSRQAMIRNIARIHPAASGTPYGTCKLVVPSTIRLTSDFEGDPSDMPSLTGGCVLHGVVTASWYAGGDNVSDAAYTVLFDTDIIDESENLDYVGVMTWKGRFAFDDQGHTYTQNAPVTTVKVGSWAGLQTSRSGSKVTINTRAVRYAYSLDMNIPWASETGVIQYRAKGGSTWTDLKAFTTNSAGATSYSYTSSATRDYRAVYTEQPYIFGTTSPTSQR